MFTNYKIRVENGKEVLYLYFDEYNTEFSNEFKEIQSEERTVKSFIEKNKIKFKGSLVKILLGTVLISTLVLPNVSAQGNLYQVKSGDSLWKIAQENNMTVDEIISINNLKSEILHPGDTIKLSNLTSNYVVKEGDSLWNLARKFNTSVENIIKLNHLSNDALSIGQELFIDGINFHTVEEGDNLWSLARKFDTSVDTIKQLNNLTTDTLQIGQELTIKGDVSTSNAYTVKYGDNLWNLAREFNTTVDSIRQLNNLSTDTLQIGQELIIDGEVATRTYIVKAGDTLWDLAKLYNTSVVNIKSTNNLTSDRLSIGQELVLTSTTTAPDKPTVKESYVRIKRNNGQIQTIELEEYIVGVVASEMDESFHMEALKAQALAARTYAVEMNSNNEIILTNHSHQVYNDETQLRELWGNEYDSYINKVKDAVYSTKGEVITYQGEYIEAMYFSTSNGKTENPLYVWGGELPYLVSVDSSQDVNSREYLETRTMSVSQFTTVLGLRNTSFDVNVLSYTKGDRVDTIQIGGTTFTGNEIRTKFGLRSTDFSIEVKNNLVYITQRGFGHGVGMSQYGAHYMGQEGYSYLDIIHHYYQNVEVVNI